MSPFTPGSLLNLAKEGTLFKSLFRNFFPPSWKSTSFLGVKPFRDLWEPWFFARWKKDQFPKPSYLVMQLRQQNRSTFSSVSRPSRIARTAYTRSKCRNHSRVFSNCVALTMTTIANLKTEARALAWLPPGLWWPRSPRYPHLVKKDLRRNVDSL